jgi:inorganic pyrophosphatase
MIYEYIPIGPQAPDIVRTIVEVPMGVSNKYKYNGAIDAFRYDRTLYSPLHYPYDYGWICGTRSPAGGRPLTCLVMAKNPTLRLFDNKGDDPKILCVALSDPRQKYIYSIADLPSHTIEEVEHFFDIYKTLERQEVRVDGWGSTEETLDLIRRCAIDTKTGESLFTSP